MPRIVFLILGIFLLVMAAGFLAGEPRLVRAKFRSRPDLKAYMRKTGAVYAVIAAVGLAYYFFEDAIFASRSLSALVGLSCFAALVALIIFNYQFTHKS